MSVKVASNRNCSDCSKNFIPTSNVQKRCPKCADKRAFLLKEEKKSTVPCAWCKNLFYAKRDANGRLKMTCSKSCAQSLNARFSPFLLHPYLTTGNPLDRPPSIINNLILSVVSLKILTAFAPTLSCGLSS